MVGHLDERPLQECLVGVGRCGLEFEFHLRRLDIRQLGGRARMRERSCEIFDER